MIFEGITQSAIDHEYFQRLRYIKQLGLAEFVFPCANHSRFQHSLGASYLASEYFQRLIRTWSESEFNFEARHGDTTFQPGETKECIESVAAHRESYDYWSQVVGLAGLLHDIGHGPWSHTFEVLMLEQDFSSDVANVPGPVGDYLRGLLASGRHLVHEDISLLYAFRILSDCVPDDEFLDYFVAVAALMNRKTLRGSYKAATENEIEQRLASRSLRGGVKMHRLLRPIISGPFDVDRIDYIQRDGRNCGVSIGGIEWRRIVGKLIPCLADHPNRIGQPDDVVLISQMNNHHVLDDFMFSLFQMYAQVYMHPKIVGLEESVKKILRDKQLESSRKIDLEFHSSLSDERFRDHIKQQMQSAEVEDLLLRKQGHTFRVTTYPEELGMDSQLEQHEFSLISILDRPMLKDSVGVFLYSPFKYGEDNHGLYPWERVSPISKEFSKINYSPKIWIRSDA